MKRRRGEHGAAGDGAARTAADDGTVPGQHRRYRTVLAAPGFRRWASASVAARLALAMSPLALVLFGAQVTGSFAFGALLAGMNAAGNVLAAPWIGRRLTVRAGLLAQATAVALLAAVATSAPLALLALLAGAAGAAPAGVPGELRSRLASLVPPSLRPAAFSLESAASAALFAAGPALVAVVALIDPRAALAVIAIAAGSGGILAARLPGAVADGALTAAPSRVRTVLRRGWPTYLMAAAFMLAVTGLDVIVPALLAGLSLAPELAGLLLGAFALTGTIGGLVYGSRAWPGTPSIHGLVLVPALCGPLSLLAILTNPAAMTLLLLLAGLLGPPALIARSLALGARLQPSDWPTGYSLLSAAAGLGASTAGLLAAPLLAATNPATSLLCILGLALTATVAAASSELRDERTRTHTA